MKIAARLSAIYFVLALGQGYADNSSVTFSVQPNRCIGLEQGQTCFATLQFKWTTPTGGEYCLFDDRESTALTCWTGRSQSEFTQPFEANENVSYEIRSAKSEEPLARVLVKVSWIYKSNTTSTSRWRLF